MTSASADTEINSLEYWSHRFLTDWVERGGREQTAFFAHLCLSHLPAWFCEQISVEQLSIFDYGCALGDAVPVINARFPKSKVSGGDFSPIAVAVAGALNPGHEFKNLPEVGAPLADITYCSNTLEHIPNWIDGLTQVCAMAKKFAIILVPFEEEELIDEHVVRFEYENIPIRVGRTADLNQIVVIDAATVPGSRWPGRQLLLIYSIGKSARRASRRSLTSDEPSLLTLDLAGMGETSKENILEILASASREMNEGRRRLEAADNRILQLETNLAAGIANAERASARQIELQSDIRQTQAALASAEEAQQSIRRQLAESATAHTARTTELVTALATVQEAERRLGDKAAKHVARISELEAALATVHEAEKRLIEESTTHAARVSELELALEQLDRNAEKRLEDERAIHVIRVTELESALATSQEAERGLVDEYANQTARVTELELALEKLEWETEKRLGDEGAQHAIRVGELESALVEHEQTAAKRLTDERAANAISVARLETASAQIQLRVDKHLSDAKAAHATRATGLETALADLKFQLKEEKQKVDILQEVVQRQGYRWDQAQFFSPAAKASAGRPANEHERLSVNSSIAIAKEQPVVSIVLPVYNHAQFVAGAIESILTQTHRRWELIIVDDGSTDNLTEIVRPFYRDRRITLVHQTNKRLPAALNTGFSWCKGQFCTWTSADNHLLPEHTEQLAEALQANPAAGLVYSDYWVIDEQGNPFLDEAWRSSNRDQADPGLIRLPDEATIENLHRSDNFIGASFMYRRELADVVGRYAEDAPGGEDYDYWMRMHLSTSFFHVKQPLYKYRVHKRSMSSNAKSQQLYSNIRRIVADDRWRLASLLADPELLLPASGASYWRPTDQFNPAIRNKVQIVKASQLQGQFPGADPCLPYAVDLDVSVRRLTERTLSGTPVLLARDDLQVQYLRGQLWATNSRIIRWDGTITDEMEHACVHAFADMARYSAQSRTPMVASVNPAFVPNPVLLLVARWSSGGLEAVVFDLASELASEGLDVTLASADGEAPPSTQNVKTMSFHGDEEAFEKHILGTGIKLVNYHHCTFATHRARRLGLTLVYTSHNSDVWCNDSRRAEIAMQMTLMDNVIAVSAQAAKFATDQYAVPADRIAVIPNGLTAETLSRIRLRRRIRGTEFQILVLASINRIKLLHVLISAFEDVAGQIPGAILQLRGAPLDGQYFEELRRQAEQSPFADRIQLLPPIERVDVAAALDGADVFILPSACEGWSIALMEAIAAGCVCIASDVGSALDMQNLGQSVLLVPSPIGETETVSAEYFYEIVNAENVGHRRNISDALLLAWRDFDELAESALLSAERLKKNFTTSIMCHAYIREFSRADRS